MKKVAIFIDHENLAHSSQVRIKESYNVSVLFGRAKEEGRVVLGKAYVPFIADTFKGDRMLYIFRRSGIDPIYTPSYPVGKSGEMKSLGDPMLICDVMSCLHERPIIDIFIICSGDKDMIPLLRKIAERGKDVVVIAVEQTSALALVKECARLDFRFEDYLQLHKPIRPKTTLKHPS